MAFKYYAFSIFPTCIVLITALHYDYDSPVVSQLPDYAVRNVGKFQPRIVVGVIPRYHDMPFVVYIQSFGRFGQSDSCTGSIIASRYVLTAFHCLENAGENFHMTLEEIRKHMLVNVGSMYKKDGRPYKVLAYDPVKTRKGDVDMVILKMDGELKFPNGTVITPVVLGRWTPKKNVVLSIAGHGWHTANGRIQRPDRYITASAKVVSNETWEGNVGFRAIGVNEGPAKGDSGGPALKPVKGNYVQIGMIAEAGKLSINANDRYIVGVYVSIGPYCHLIQEKTNGSARCIRANN
uniref:Peptidase S1 domain-containing protein n=1 Tax=Panagrellus redivivus TaxID=6233 RepID=A0A7E4ZRB2_PANRE